MANMILVATLLLTSLAAFAQADYVTGDVLYRQCGGTRTMYGQGVCDGYIAGVATGLSINGQICYPDKITAEQAANVILSYLDNRPADTGDWKYRVVELALIEAFPCDGDK